MIKLLFSINLILLTNGYCVTRVCGYIRNATDWTRERSPYLVQNDIYIPANSRLSVEPGVTIQFLPPGPCRDSAVQLSFSDSMYSGIKVEGIFSARGTEEHPIIFERAPSNKKKIGWEGVRINNRTPSVVSFDYCHFKNAHTAIHAKRSHFSISHCVFESNNVGVKLIQYSNSHIINNSFVKNKSCGVFIEGSNPVVLNNVFAMNLGYGIWSDSRNMFTIQYNDFWENGEGHCYRCPSEILKMVQLNRNNDSSDVHFNIQEDPIFKNSPSYKKEVNRDISIDTDSGRVIDTKMALVEKIYRKIRKDKKIKVNHNSSLGSGPWALSKYSRLIHAGHPNPQFNNKDNTVNDIGSYGGTSKGRE